MPAHRRPSPAEEDEIRSFVTATKDYGFRSWDDAWGEMPRGYLPKFDCGLLGRYDPAREDCPGQIPVRKVTEEELRLCDDDPENHPETAADATGEDVAPEREVISGPRTIKIYERNAEPPPFNWGILLLVPFVIVWPWCVYRTCYLLVTGIRAWIPS